MLFNVIRKNVDSRRAEEKSRAEQRLQEIVFENSNGPFVADSVSGEEQSALLAIKRLIVQGLEQNASDIFFEPQPDGKCSVRMRIAGTLTKVCDIEASEIRYIEGTIKAVADMNVSERKRPQNGSFTARIDGEPYSFRVASVGVYSGEKISVRIVGCTSGPRTLSDLGFSSEEHSVISQIIAQNSGMVLICGPAGSGKNTTRSVILKSMDLASRNIVSVEERIGNAIPQITQMEVNALNGITYTSLLRSALLQTPDVIALDSLCESEAAGVAVQAAQSASLVIACTDKPGCADAVWYLHESGVPLRSIASALRAVVCQRLVRTLCPHCKRQVNLSPELAGYFAQTDLPTDNICAPTGCPHCDGTGYAGYRAVFDVMVPDQQLMALFESGDPERVCVYIDEIHGQSMMAFRGYQLAAQGVCSIDEVNRVILNVG
jgi:type II secretory ATPase GspE/PulE/Tfp pilus assembly ATPase PilB-like protein